MKKIRLTPLFFRRIHKWVGLILGLQFVLWTLSGSVMALLDKDEVAAHDHSMGHAHPLPEGAYFDVAALSNGEPVQGVVLRDLGTRPVYEVRTEKGVRLVDATDGAAISVDEGLAREVASMMNEAPIRQVSLLPKSTLETRDHEGRMCRMDVGSAHALLDTVRQLLARGHALDAVLPAFTRNIARHLRLAGKGEIMIGADADLVALDADGRVADVMAQGVWHVRDGATLRMGMFENPQADKA